MNNKYNPFLSKPEKQKIEFVTKYIKPHLLKIEVVMSVLVVLALVFELQITSIVLLLLSGVYFFMGFSEYKSDNKTRDRIRVFMEYLINWGRSVSLVGILFVLTNWPGAELQLRIGLITIFASLLIILYFIIKDSKDEIFSLIEFFRSLIVFAIAILIYLQDYEFAI